MEITGFAKKLVPAICRKLPGWSAAGTAVKYIDPLNTTKDEIDLLYCKDFRYVYQKEYRFIWTPRTAATILDPIDIHIGSLKDSCDLVTLVD